MNVSDAARLRKILPTTPCSVGYLQDNDNTWTTNSGESLNILLDTHFPENSQTEFAEEEDQLESDWNTSVAKELTSKS